MNSGNFEPDHLQVSFDSNLIQVIECKDYSLLLINHPNIGLLITKIFSIDELFIDHIHQTKAPNCFLLFRMIFSKAIKEAGIKLERKYISKMAGSCWKSSVKTKLFFKNIYKQLKQLLPEKPNQTDYNSTPVVNSMVAYPACFENNVLNNNNNIYADEFFEKNNYLLYQNQSIPEQPHQINYMYNPTSVVNSMAAYPVYFENNTLNNNIIMKEDIDCHA
ncbi:13481_t:CDS:1 [Ambispora gerdemannii]|uniref:13481_t:CDS:1 n=1 Tax=Ambispora gerdemannii TaxID=144530 RepID=A0A9N9CNS6_9GLOM|nr:13481_t:CDS:1 [Ambispora gerdemannii]